MPQRILREWDAGNTLKGEGLEQTFQEEAQESNQAVIGNLLALFKQYRELDINQHQPPPPFTCKGMIPIPAILPLLTTRIEANTDTLQAMEFEAFQEQPDKYPLQLQNLLTKLFGVWS